MIAGLVDFIGLPYDKYDCWQFVCHYYKQALNIILPSFEGEYKNGDDITGINRIYTRELAHKTWPKVACPNYPDLVVFKVEGKQWHVGIVLDQLFMLHTQRGCNSVIERYRSLRWKNRLHGFYRYQK